MTTESFPRNNKQLQLLIEDNVKYYSHPYINELNNISYNQTQFEYFKGEIHLIVPQSVEHIYFIELIMRIHYEKYVIISQHCNVIALHLQHYSKYTFYGMTCLIQISIGNGNDVRDYIIDTLELRSLIHLYLNPIFTNEIHQKHPFNILEIKTYEQTFSFSKVQICRFIKIKRHNVDVTCLRVSSCNRIYCSKAIPKFYMPKLCNLQTKTFDGKICFYGCYVAFRNLG